MKFFHTYIYSRWTVAIVNNFKAYIKSTQECSLLILLKLLISGDFEIKTIKRPMCLNVYTEQKRKV